MTLNKSVRRTFLSLRADLVRQCQSLPESDLQSAALRFLMSLEPETSSILQEYPALFREINVFLAMGCMPSSRLAWLSDAVDLASRGYPDESLCEIIRLVRQALGFYSRLTVGGKADRRTPWTAVDVGQSTGGDAIRKAVTRLTRETVNDQVPLVANMIARCLFEDWSEITAVFDGHCDVPFRHGPGAVAEGRSVQKMKSLINCIEDPSYDWIYEPFFRPLFVDGIDEWRGRYSQLYPNHPIGATASRMVTVPKDYRGPRVIAAEPALHQYVQQGVARLILTRIKQTPLRECIDLEHSEKNARAAMLASMTGAATTIDLSDASDMVSRNVVGQLFAGTVLGQVIDLARTTKIETEDGVFELTAFAPMGSGLCFPIETLVFAIVAISSCWNRTDAVTFRNIRKYIRKMELRVYGDDIVVHSDYARSVIAAIEAMGAVVNHAKTCTYSSFKESCGVDAYGGYDVTPLRPRHLPGASEYSYMGLRDNIQDAVNRGFYNLAACLIQFWVRSQTIQGFEPQVLFCPASCQYAGKPGVLTVPDDVFDVMSFFHEPSKRSRLRTIWPRTVREPDDVERRLREALRGAPRDADGFILETTTRKPSSILGHKTIRAVSAFHTPDVIECSSARQATRLLLSL